MDDTNEMTGISLGLGAMAGPVYAVPESPVYAYVLNAHGSSEFKGCPGEVEIPDNIILQYFYDPAMKDSVICLSKDGEKRLCSKEFPMREEFQFTSASIKKPPELVLLRLDDTGTNTGFYECHTNHWIASDLLGPVEPSPSGEIDINYTACLSVVLRNFSEKFKQYYGPYAKAGIYMALCSTPFEHNLPNTTITAYDPSIGLKKSLAQYKKNERRAEREAYKQDLRNEFVRLLMLKQGTDKNKAQSMANSVNSRETLESYIVHLQSLGGGYSDKGKYMKSRNTRKKKVRKIRKTRRH